MGLKFLRNEGFFPPLRLECMPKRKASYFNNDLFNSLRTVQLRFCSQELSHA